MQLIYKCKQAHQMVSEGLDRELNFSERARLKLHLSICESCTNFNTQMQTLRLAMRKLRSDSIDSKEETK
jgi:predicted anti-sigma-YlaC factor YlaD